MSDIADWEAVPVTGSKSQSKSAPAAKSANKSITSDWDSVPIKSASTSAPTKVSEGIQRRTQYIGQMKDAHKALIEGDDESIGLGAGEGALNVVSGIGSSIAGGLAGGARTLYNLAAGEGIDKSVQLGGQTVNAVQNAGTYQPTSATGKLVASTIGLPFDAAKDMTRTIGGDVGQAANGDKGRMVGEAIGETVPDVVGTLYGGRSALKGAKTAPVEQVPLREMPPTQAPPTASNVPAYIRKAQAEFESKRAAGQAQGQNPVTPAGVTQTGPAAPPVVAPIAPTSPVVPSLQAAGAQAADLSRQAEASGASAHVKDAIADAGENVHTTAAQRHIEASSLPVPIDLTAGMATGDVNLLSHERNMRGQYPQLAERFNGINGKLVQNIEAIRDSAGPDVPHANHVESGQALIDSYKTIDDAFNQDISAKYKELRDANGGKFPVDAGQLLNNVKESLRKELLSHDAPVSQMRELERLSTEGNMTMEDFLSLRRNLGNVARTAVDGNTRTAASIMIKNLESLPLSPSAASLTPLANAARSAAKARFDLIDADPAYKAAINDSTPADNFIKKHVVKAPLKDVQTMQANLAHDPIAKQTIATGTVNYLRDRAMDSGTKFKQKGFNDGLKELRPKLNDLVQPEQAAHLEALGNVARYTMEQPEGSYVNNSNTQVSAAAAAKKAAATAANTVVDKATLGASRYLRERKAAAIAEQENNAMLDQMLKPGAGIKLSDFPK